MKAIKTFRSKSNFDKDISKITTNNASNFDLSQLKLNLQLQLNSPQQLSLNFKQPHSQTSTFNNIESLNSTRRSLKVKNYSLHQQNSQNLIQTCQNTPLQSPNKLKNSNSFYYSDRLSKNSLQSQEFLDLNLQNQSQHTKLSTKRAQEVIPQIQQQIKHKVVLKENKYFTSVDVREEKMKELGILNNQDSSKLIQNKIYPNKQNERIVQKQQIIVQKISSQPYLVNQKQSSQNSLCQVTFNEQNQKQQNDDYIIKFKEQKDKIFQKRQNILSLFQYVPIYEELKSIVNQFFILYSKAIEEAEQRFVLIPTQENLLHQKLLEGEQYLHKILQRLTQQIIQAQQNFDSEIKKEKNKQFQLNTQISQLLDQIDKQNNSDNACQSIQNSIQQNNKQNIELVYQNVQLQQLSNNLASKLYGKQADDNTNILTQNEQLKKQVSQLQIENSENLYKLDQNIILLNSTIFILKAQLKKLEDTNKDLDFSNKNILQQNKQISHENEILNKQINNLKQQLDTTNQDKSDMQKEIDEMRIIILTNTKIIKELKEKLNKLTVQKMTFIIPPENNDFNDEKYFLDSIQSSYFNKNYFIKQMKATMDGFDTQQIQINVRKFQDDDKNDLKVDLTKYKYNLPQFYCFIQENFQNLFKQVENTTQIPYSFLATIRGILDSKYNEFLLSSSQNYSNVSLFADFVYSWLTTFDINQTSRKITKFHTNTLTSNLLELRIAQFYITLNNHLLSKLWEFVTFREILNEELSKEELYFYLFCRNQIFKGPQLESTASTFEIINYIKIEEAEILIRSILTKFDQSTTEYLISQIKNKAVLKSKKQLIDAHLVLRLLLEYFRTERQQRYKLIKQLFYSQQCENKDGKYTLNFTSFRNIFHKNFVTTTELEKAQIFRECYSIGKGIVNHDTFFTVCNENGFFIKQLKLNLPTEFPIFNKIIKQYEPDQLLLSQNLQEFYNFYIDEQFQKNCQIISQYIQSQGLESQLYNFELFIKQNDQFNKNLICQNLQGKNFILFLFEKIKEIQTSVYLKIFQKQVEIDDFQIIQIQKSLQEQLSCCCKTAISILQKNKQQKYELQTQRVTVLQRWTKRKISKWYTLINDLLLSKFKTMLLKQGVQPFLKVNDQIITEKTDNEEQENDYDIDFNKQTSKQQQYF
ncbi:hypothetical protein ABPG74_003985 [Tetrahymena malaccensis]